MANLQKAAENLRARGFSAQIFSTGAEAAAYLNREIDGKTVGFGGSVTIQEMGLYESLSQHNTVYWHWNGTPVSTGEAMQSQVYLCSANGLSEEGDILNIDGTGNRISSTLFGHQTVYFVVGRNKLAPTYEAALWRVRNVAAPKNAQRLGRKTPCAVKADRCYDCKSPDRICRALTVLWQPLMADSKTEVVLIDEDLGY